MTPSPSTSLTMPAQARRARRVLLALLVVAGAGLVHLGVRVAVHGPSRPAAPRELSPPPAPAGLPRLVATPPWARAADEAAPAAPADEAPEQVPPSAYYEAQSIYPPTSRPLSRERNPDLIAWNTPDVPWLRSESGTLTYRLTSDVAWLVGSRPLTVILEARHGEAPAPVEITAATARVDAPRGAPLPDAARAPAPLAFVPDGDRWVATLDPARFGALDRSVAIVVEVELRHGPARFQRAAHAVLYTPAAAAPARFTGELREAREDGSLAVYATVEVTRPGWYNVDANLWDAAGEPVGWTRWKGELAAGRHEVRLPFFGKVLVDSGRPGPWHLGQLRGFLYDAERSPPEQVMAPFAGDFATRAWSLSDFSAAEWDDPRRDAERATWRELEARGDAPPIPAAAYEADLPKERP